jgi:oxygen-independent coproporphyrinogen-3 oxidase
MEAHATERAGEGERPVAVYIHVPFCRSRCSYCDFNTYAGLESLMPQYCTAVCKEIRGIQEHWGSLQIATVYLGGGTPSLLPVCLLELILDALDRHHRLERRIEVTLEANPGTVTRRYVSDLARLGVNRLSVGAQSLHSDELALLGRTHTWAEVEKTVEDARSVGLPGVNLDFIFGLPGQDLDRWLCTVEAALKLEPEHLSLYSLTVEHGTALADAVARGELLEPSEDAGADMYAAAECRLAEMGYFHYEISNWARATGDGPAGGLGNQDRPSGYQWWPADHRGTSEETSQYVCRHNLAYWRNEPWLGVGAGAHSWWRGCRWSNHSHPREYIAAIEAAQAPVAWREEIDRRLEMSETMMMGLRLAEGVEADGFFARFGERLKAVYGSELGQLRALGLLQWDGRVARLTTRGRLLGNWVFERFV